MHHSVCNIAYRVGHRGRITFCFVKASGVASDPVASVTEEYVDHNNVRRFGNLGSVHRTSGLFIFMNGML